MCVPTVRRKENNMKNYKTKTPLRKFCKNLTYRFSQDYKLEKKIARFLKGRSKNINRLLVHRTTEV
jgi:hypothetical protein